MKNLIIALIVVASGHLFSQSERLQSMGGLNFSLPDEQYSFNPFDFGNNPAWLYKDEMASWLKIIPGYSGYSGDYKRRFDPGVENNYGITFSGVKSLGEDGTFLGETSYYYNFRKDVPNSLKYNPYKGEAFFLTDTATGNFRYNGPSIKFSYSFEPLSNLFTGAAVSYRILDGLKSVYSRAEVLFRDIDANFGAAYQLYDNLVFGVNYTYKDNQEKIESKSEDLLDVEIYNYKGESYAIKKRASSVSQKLSGVGHRISGQLYYIIAKSTEIGLIGSFGSEGQQVLMSRSVTGQSFNEYEEGYTNFNLASIALKARQQLSDDMFFGITAGYDHNYVWSKNSPKNRLIWEWEINTVKGGLGLSWKPVENLSVAAEYEYSNLDADSSKYIDSRFATVKSGDHVVKAGFEFQWLRNIYLRGGYNFGFFERDIVFGGKDIEIHKLTTGLGLYILPEVGIDIHIEYGFYNGLPEGFRRSNYSAFTTVKLNSF